ncbi:MAG: hypothetical protein HY536_00825, partial [Candidatus Colwellbacteria bacterium]|nr:hypothetical protein [Candidatus Colwellbacteria bacterium]
QYALIEVTSEGVVQHRHRFIEWDAGLILNLHPEHIEAHGGFERYRAAKVRFFEYIARSSRKRPRYFFINSDDEHSAYFARAAERAKEGMTIRFGGGFMTANYNAARAVGRAFGISDEAIERALREFPGLPGRMEVIQKEPFLVLVDYAHTLVSLEEVYKRVRGMNPKRMICVLGSAGGGRDKWKRPGLGALAERYCDEIVLTNEDPFDENPAKIMTEIRAGIRRSEGVHEVLDRREAIRRAVALAAAGDAVILTGKGSERAIRLARGEEIAWNEAREAREALRDEARPA